MAHTDPSMPVPKLVLELEGDRGEFLAFGKPNQWALMQNAEAQRSGKNGDAMASTYRLAMSSVIPSDRERFSQWMEDHGQAEEMEEVLTTGLLDLWDGKTMLPLEPTSSDSSGSTGGTASTSTVASSVPESSPELEEPDFPEIEDPAPKVAPYPMTILSNGDQRVGSSIPA